MDGMLQQGEVIVDTMLTQTDIADAVRSTALLANLTIGLWSGERSDSTVSARVKADAGAVGNVGRYTKNLLAGCDNSLKDLRGIFTSARTQHYKLTLPYVSDPHAERNLGPRLLPNMLFIDYVTKMNGIRTAALAKLDSFVAEYPSLQMTAMANLAGLAKKEDYPSVDFIKGAFRLSFDFEPLPDKGGFANLPDNVISSLAKGLARKQQAAVNAAMGAMWDRVRDHVSHLAERLADPDAVFKEASVENTRELVNVLPGFNLTQDPRVSEVIADIERMLDGVDAKQIRASNALRKDVSDRAKGLTDKLTSWGL